MGAIRAMPCIDRYAVLLALVEREHEAAVVGKEEVFFVLEVVCVAAVRYKASGACGIEKVMENFVGLVACGRSVWSVRLVHVAHHRSRLSTSGFEKIES